MAFCSLSFASKQITAILCLRSARHCVRYHLKLRLSEDFMSEISNLVLTALILLTPFSVAFGSTPWQRVRLIDLPGYTLDINYQATTRQNGGSLNALASPLWFNVSRSPSTGKPQSFTLELRDFIGKFLNSTRTTRLRLDSSTGGVNRFSGEYNPSHKPEGDLLIADLLLAGGLYVTGGHHQEFVIQDELASRRPTLRSDLYPRVANPNQYIAKLTWGPDSSHSILNIRSKRGLPALAFVCSVGSAHETRLTMNCQAPANSQYFVGGDLSAFTATESVWLKGPAFANSLLGNVVTLECKGCAGTDRLPTRLGDCF